MTSCETLDDMFGVKDWPTNSFFFFLLCFRVVDGDGGEKCVV